MPSDQDEAQEAGDKAIVLTGQPDEAEQQKNSRTASFKMGGQGIADTWNVPEVEPPPPPTFADELEAKRAAAIAAREEARREKVIKIKKSKFTKNLERQAAEEKAAAARAAEAEKKARLAEIEAKRQANILRKEAEHKAKAEALRARKLHQKKANFLRPDVLVLAQVHEQADTDKSGSVSIDELKAALKASALSESLVAAFDRNNDGAVSLSELLKLVYPHANETDLEVMHAWIAEAHAPPPPPPKRALTPKELGEIHAIFSKYDDDKSGGLSAKELKAALKGKFEGVEDAEVDEVFKAYDQDESATLDRAEFQALIVSWIDYHG